MLIKAANLLFFHVVVLYMSSVSEDQLRYVSVYCKLFLEKLQETLIDILVGMAFLKVSASFS